MPPTILRLLRRTGGAFGALTAAQKTVGVLALAAVVLGGFAFVRWVSEPTFAPLFTNLAASDASAIVEQLDAEGAAYELADGGQSVLVPREDVYRLRLAMSSAGLPTSGDTGYALLDQQGVTTSQFQQQVTYQRALEGELARTIGSIAGVETAVVHLAIPQKDVFLDETAAPTASVLIDTEAGASVPAQQVQSIVHLVSSSVEQMAPEDVTVVDDAGALLSAAGEGTAAAAGGAREQQTLDYENSTATAIQRMLDRVLGQGNAVATVTAELNFDNTDRTAETFTAQEGVPPLSQTSTTEEYTGAGTPVGGVLGPDNVQAPAGGDADSTYRKESATSNNAVDKVTEHTTTAPGALRRQSVAVVVNDQAAAGVDMAELTEMVGTAAGIDEQRGDSVAVSAMAFDTTAAERAAEDLAASREAAEREKTMGLVRTGATAGAVLLVLLVVFFLSRRARRRAEIAEFENLGHLRVVPEEPVALEAADVDAIEGARPQALPPALPAPDSAALIRDEVADLVERQPDEVAQLLRGWLADRRS